MRRRAGDGIVPNPAPRLNQRRTAGIVLAGRVVMEACQAPIEVGVAADAVRQSAP